MYLPHQRSATTRLSTKLTDCIALDAACFISGHPIPHFLTRRKLNALNKSNQAAAKNDRCSRVGRPKVTNMRRVVIHHHLLPLTATPHTPLLNWSYISNCQSNCLPILLHRKPVYEWDVMVAAILCGGVLQVHHPFTSVTCNNFFTDREKVHE